MDSLAVHLKVAQSRVDTAQRETFKLHIKAHLADYVRTIEKESRAE